MRENDVTPSNVMEMKIDVTKNQNGVWTALNSPNHCGRHLGKINGHKSVYVLTWRCSQDEFYVIFMQSYLNKLLQSQAEVYVLIFNAKQVYQSSV